MRNKVFLIGSAIVLIAIAALVLGTFGHVGEAIPAPQPGGEPLSPIIVEANGSVVSIGVDDIAAYNGMMEGEDPHFCVCCACMYRVLSAGIREVWGEEIPERSDIGIRSRLVSNGALYTGWYVTGTGPGMAPDQTSQVLLVAPNGSVLTDYSEQTRMKIAKNRSPEDYRFVGTRLSTGESADLSVRSEVFPPGFFELRQKVKVDKIATGSETAEFEAEWDTLMERFMQQQDDELFIRIETPEDGGNDRSGV